MSDEEPPDPDRLRERVRELEQTVEQQSETIAKMLPGRRAILSGVAGAGLGAAGMFYGSERASAQASGQVGTSSKPLDAHIYSAFVDSRLDLPVYSSDSNAPNATQFYNSSDQIVRYKDSNGNIRTPDAIQDGEDFDGQGTSVFSNLQSVDVEDANIASNFNRDSPNDHTLQQEIVTSRTDNAEITSHTISSDTGSTLDSYGYLEIYLHLAANGAFTYQMRVAGDGSSTGNYDYNDLEALTSTKDANEWLLSGVNSRGFSMKMLISPSHGSFFAFGGNANYNRESASIGWYQGGPIGDQITIFSDDGSEFQIRYSVVGSGWV